MSEIRKMLTNESEKGLLLAILAELQGLSNWSTTFGERFFGNVTNSVLSVEKVEFTAAGYISRSYPASAGSVEIRAYGADVTYVVGGATGAAPNTGIGVYVVPAGAVQMISLSSTSFTLYGTPSNYVAFQVYSKGRE